MRTTELKSPVDESRELEQIQAESIGWMPLELGAYLHVSDPDATEILIVGVAQAGPAVLLLD